MNDPGMINGEVPRPVTGDNPRSSWNGGHNSSTSLSFGLEGGGGGGVGGGGGNGPPPEDTANLRSLSMDDAISLLRDRQQATETLNHLLQKELNDHRLAESYQAFRARYLRALNKLHPVVYEERDVMASDREIRAYLKQLRTEEAAKKVRCQKLQDAWLFYDSVATDKPEVLSAEDKKVEGQMDEIEESIMQEWLEFAADVVTRAEEWDDASVASDWRADAERFKSDLQQLKARQTERDEMRKRAELRRMHQIMRQRRGDVPSSELEFSDDEDEGTKKSMKSSRSKKKKKDKEKDKDKKKDKSSSSSSSKDKVKSSSKSKNGHSNGESAVEADEDDKPSEENRLLEEVFPPHIAKALREGRKVEAEERAMVTIFFSDIVGFTNISSMISPLKVSEMLDRLYHKFDKLSREHDVYKVETIGDRYVKTNKGNNRIGWNHDS